MTVDSIDLTYRDPNNLNDHVQVMFEDVLAEAEGAHSMDCVWQNSHKCFSCSLNCCYKMITFFCGIFVALSWGCTFACVAFTQVWCFTPYIRLTYVIMKNIKKLYSITLNACLGPCFEAIGMVFSRIHVTNSSAAAPKPLDYLPSGRR